MPSDDPKVIWAYTYRIVPPQDSERLEKVRALLETEHAEARRAAAVWEGRLVADDRVTHLLVLADSPDLGRDVNRRIEAELRALQVRFSVTIPLAVDRAGTAELPDGED